MQQCTALPKSGQKCKHINRQLIFMQIKEEREVHFLVFAYLRYTFWRTC